MVKSIIVLLALVIGAVAGGFALYSADVNPFLMYTTGLGVGMFINSLVFWEED